MKAAPGPGRLISAILALASMMLLSCAIAPSPTVSDTGRAGTEVSGSINEDTNWTLADGPFIVKDDVSVASGATLSITSGCVVKFAKGTKLTVQGAIRATDVRFTSDQSVPSPGDWEGMMFLSADGANSSLAGSIIEYATTGITLMSTDMILSGITVRDFSLKGLSIMSSSTATVEQASFTSTDGGYAIHASGTLYISKSTIDAMSGISLGSGLQTVDSNSISVRRTGIVISSGTNCQVSNNVIFGNGEGDFGISISSSSAVFDITMNDVSGFGIGIFVQTQAAGTISRDNVHTNRDFGINSLYPISITDCYFGRVPALADDVSRPSDLTSKVTVSGTRGFPYEIEGLAQPPIVVITSHKGQDTVKGVVNVTGHAYEADVGYSIDKVEYKVQNGTSGENVTSWAPATGTVDWSIAWDTRALVPGRNYQLWVRAEADDDATSITAIELIVLKDDGGGGGGNNTNNTNGTGDGGGKEDTSLLGLPPLVFWSIIIIMMVAAVTAFAVVYVRMRKDEAVRSRTLQQLQTQWLEAARKQQQQQPQQVLAVAPSTAEADRNMVIEDVFLIYKDGRLLNHESRRLRPEMDDDMLVGMFTAIQEFIKGAFPAESDDPGKNIVNEISRGDEKVLLEHGRFVYLAVVVRATETARVHARMKDVIADLEKEKQKVLEKWDGNMAVTGELKQYTKRLITGPF